MQWRLVNVCRYEANAPERTRAQNIKYLFKTKIIYQNYSVEFNSLRTKRYLSDLKTQLAPRSKHFLPRL